MVRYPIRLSIGTTGSGKPREQAKVREFNRTASAVEKHINDKIAAAPEDSFHQFTHAIVALDLGLDEALVRSVLASAHGGYNGITIVKGDRNRAFDRNFAA